MIKFFITIFLSVFILTSDSYTRTKTSLTIRDLTQNGYRLMQVVNGGLVYIFVKEDDIYECIKRKQYHKKSRCYHLTDGL